MINYKKINFFWVVLMLITLIFLINITQTSFDRIKNLMSIFIWPVIILIIIFKFKETLTYFVFSFKEFNFFGAKGELKNPMELINEKVEERVENKRLEEKVEKIQDRDEKIKTLWEILSKKDRLIKTLSYNNELLRKRLSFEEIKKEEVKDQIKALLYQIAFSQKDQNNEKDKREQNNQ